MTMNHFALTEQQIFSAAPSVFATTKHDSRSERFKPIPTIDMVRALQVEGWDVAKAQQSISRDASRQPYTKHMLRFRKRDRQDLVVGGNILELLLINGNDGSAAYRLDAGIFRIVCSNGLIVKAADYGSVKIRHTGDVVQKVIAGSYEVLKNAERALTAPQDWGKIQLNDNQRYAFAKGAAVERWGVDEETGNMLAPVKPEALLEARRFDDMGHDLWSTFNV